MRLTGELLRPTMEGRVELAGATVHVDRVLDLVEPAVPNVPAASDVPPPPREAGPFDNLALAADIELVIPDNLQVRGRDLQAPGSDSPLRLGDVNITMGGYLRWRKAPGDSFRVIGSVHPVRGTYEFQGREFEIVRGGTIAFAGLPELNPRLDLTARRDVSGVETRVEVGGTLRSPVLELSSTPPLDEADILALIVFNQPLNLLGTGEQISLARRAAGLAAGFVTSRLTESLANAFEVDVLDIDIAGESLTPALTVGEQFADGLYLKFKQQFGAAPVSSAIVEYQLTDWLRLESHVSRGDATAARSLLRRVEQGGINLLFRFGY